MSQTDNLVRIATATSVMMALLIDELDKAGSLSKQKLRQMIVQAAHDAEQHAPERGYRRIDTQMFRRVADLLGEPKETWLIVDSD